jgi:NAD(P)-dependent dehydrogenase (short-subunit alcohol dehydrogenase family)
MGLAMAQQLLKRKHTLLCISRNSNPALTDLAQQHGANLSQWNADLADASKVANRLQDWLQAQDASAYATVQLINNAGVIPPLLPLRSSQPADLAQALTVGLVAPMQLGAAFLAATRTWTASKKFLNISSGLGRHAMASSAAYCAAKAGMDHFTRCLALEEAQRSNGAKVCSLAPGVIDTDMQTQLRDADAADFPEQARFAGLHSQKQLSSPEDAARRVLAYLDRADFGARDVADVRDSAQHAAIIPPTPFIFLSGAQHVP